MKKKILAGAVSLILIMNSFSAITVAAETKSAESVTDSYKESTESDITLSESAGSGGESSSGKNSDADSSAGTVSEDTVSEGSSTEETPFDAASYGSAFTASAKPTEDAGIEAGVYSIASKIDTQKSLAVKGDGCASDIPIVISGSASYAFRTFAVTPLGDGLYSIINEGSGSSLDIKGNGKTSGTAVQQYRRNYTAAQKFRILKGADGFCTITPSSCNLVLDVGGGFSADGSTVDIYEYNGTNAQYFRFDKATQGELTEGTYIIHSGVLDSKVLDICGGSASSGANLNIYAGNLTAAQQYTVTELTDSSLLISPVCSSLALDVSGGGAKNGVNIGQYNYNNSAAQKWKAEPTGRGTYTLSPLCATGYCMDVAAGSSDSGTNVQLWEANGTKAQEFSFEKIDAERTLPNGSFTISSMLDSSKVLDIAAGSVKSGANVQLYSSNGTYAQKFFLSYQGGGWYVVKNAGSAKVLDVSGASTVNGSNVQQYTENGTAAQKWKFINKGSGKRILQSALGNVLDVDSAKTANGTNIQTWTSNGTQAQLFTMTPVYAVQKAGRNSYIVAIDAGHQLHSNTGTEPIGPGSSTYKQKVSSGTYGQWSGLNEYQLNLDVSLKLRDELQSRGYEVYMIRTTNDVNISNAQRANLAAAAGADIFIRIHANGVDNSSVSGALCYEPSSSNPYLSSSVISGSQRLAQLLVNNECASTGLNNKGVISGDDMTGINWAKMPVAIVEMGFMSNYGDDLFMASSSGQAAIVRGLANGVDSYFGQ